MHSAVLSEDIAGKKLTSSKIESSKKCTNPFQQFYATIKPGNKAYTHASHALYTLYRELTQVHAGRKREGERCLLGCNTMKACTSSYCGQVPCTYRTEADV